MTLKELNDYMNKILENIENCRADIPFIAEKKINDHSAMAEYLSQNLFEIETKVNEIKYEIQTSNLKTN